MTRWLERLLLVVGIALLGWYSTVKIAASREQAALSRELEAARTAADRAQHGPRMPRKARTQRCPSCVTWSDGSRCRE